MAKVQQPPGEAEIRGIEEALDQLASIGDHDSVRRLNRHLLDVGLQADYDMASMRWKVRRQSTFADLKGNILNQQQVEQKTAKEAQDHARQKEAAIKMALMEALKVLGPNETEFKKQLTQAAMIAMEEARREAQRSEVRWNKPEQAKMEEARERMRAFERRPPWTENPQEWGQKSEKQKEEEKRKKEEEERLSAPDIDRSLAALLDGIDINMRGDSSGQQEKGSDGACAPADARGGDTHGEAAGDAGGEDDEEDLRDSARYLPREYF